MRSYLYVSDKIHFNWCKHCGSQFVWEERIYDNFFFAGSEAQILNLCPTLSAQCFDVFK